MFKNTQQDKIDFIKAHIKQVKIKNNVQENVSLEILQEYNKTLNYTLVCLNDLLSSQIKPDYRVFYKYNTHIELYQCQFTRASRTGGILTIFINRGSIVHKLIFMFMNAEIKSLKKNIYLFLISLFSTCRLANILVTGRSAYGTEEGLYFLLEEQTTSTIDDLYKILKIYGVDIINGDQ